MAFSFESLNKSGKRTIKEGIDTEKMTFVPLKDYIGKELKLDGFFFTDKGKYGKQVVVIADGKKVNIPKRYVEQFEAICDNKEALDDLIAGHVALTDIEEIDSKNGKTVAFAFKTV